MSNKCIRQWIRIDLGEEVPEVDRAYALKCLYAGTVYEDGSQWKATHEACKMCSCQRGKMIFFVFKVMGFLM